LAFKKAKPPLAGLIEVNGVLYGTTYRGGASNDGTVFSITTSGTESVIYNFKGFTDGINPYGTLSTLGANNCTLYGTTNEGGYGFGTVYELTLPTSSCSAKGT